MVLPYGFIRYKKVRIAEVPRVRVVRVSVHERVVPRYVDKVPLSAYIDRVPRVGLASRRTRNGKAFDSDLRHENVEQLRVRLADPESAVQSVARVPGPQPCVVCDVRDHPVVNFPYFFNNRRVARSQRSYNGVDFPEFLVGFEAFKGVVSLSGLPHVRNGKLRHVVRSCRRVGYGSRSRGRSGRRGGRVSRRSRTVNVVANVFLGRGWRGGGCGGVGRVNVFRAFGSRAGLRRVVFVVRLVSGRLSCRLRIACRPRFRSFSAACGVLRSAVRHVRSGGFLRKSRRRRVPRLTVASRIAAREKRSRDDGREDYSGC